MGPHRDSDGDRGIPAERICNHFFIFYELQNDEFMPPGMENPDQERA
ncbi:hypothetical protein ES705_43785 [subsurface metagenome]